MLNIKPKKHFIMRGKLNLFLIFIILLCLASSCSKDGVEADEDTSYVSSQNDYDVSVDLAKSVAMKFSKAQTSLKSLQSDSEKNIKSIITFENDNNEPLIYVCQYDSVGFVIISGSKKDTPILGYSETGAFDFDSTSTDYEAIADWINIRKNRVEELKNDTSISVSEDIDVYWDAMMPTDDEDEEEYTSTGEEVGPLMSTKWGQGCGYNALLDDCDGNTTLCNKVLAGCVAVAVAQVMKYWEYPDDYDWSEMPYSSGTTETATLMRDLGADLDMTYTCTASSAYTSDVPDLLVSYGYSSNVSYTSYSTSTLLTELKNGRPVILRGVDTSEGGHAWVCDGYTRTKYTTIHNPDTKYEYSVSTYTSPYLHMNWGWKGSYNGWFLYNDFTPSKYDFGTKNYMVVRIYI